MLLKNQALRWGNGLEKSQARMVATNAFAIATKRMPGKPSLTSPWGLPSNTTCTILENSKFPLEGDQCLLETEPM